MKKLMLGMFILLFVVAVSCVGSVKKAEALPLINGTVTFDGDVTTDTGDLLTATVVSFVDAEVSNVTGDLSDFADPQAVSFSPLQFSPFVGPLNPLWTWRTIPFRSMI